MFKLLLKRKKLPKSPEIYESKACKGKGHLWAKILDDGIKIHLKPCDEKGNICWEDRTKIEILRTKIDDFYHHVA